MVALGQNVIEIIIKARDEFSRAFNKANMSLQKFQKSALAATAIGIGIAAGFAKAIKTSIDFESAFTGVRKTVELSEKEFGDLEKRFKTLSTETGTTFVELAKIGELAGQLGVQGVDNIDKFTRTIADLSVTTNLTAEEAATNFARFANIMNMPIDQVDRLGSVVVDLGNNLATTEAEIVSMGLRISGAGKALSFTEGEVMAWSAALSSVGIRAELGGTAISKLMINISSMVATGSKDLVGFANVAGMTSAEFSKAFEEDASKALQTFFEGLSKVEEGGGNVLSVIEQLGIKEVRLRDAVLRLSSSYGTLDNALGIQGAAWEENTALVDEAAKRYNTMERQIAKTKAKFAIIGDEIGDRLVPIFRDYLIPLLDKLINWWQNLSPWMKDAILLFFGVTVAVTLLAGAIALVTLVASPWLLIIGAIILAITGLILIIKNWGKIVEFTQKSKFAPFFTFLKLLFLPQILAIKIAIKLLGFAFRLLWSGFLKPLWDKFKRFVDFLEKYVLPIINKIAKVANAVSGFISGAINKVSSAIPGGKTESVDDFILQPGGRLIKTNPNDTIMGSKNGMGGIVVNIENIYGTDPDEIAEALNEKLKTMISI